MSGLCARRAKRLDCRRTAHDDRCRRRDRAARRGHLRGAQRACVRVLAPTREAGGGARRRRRQPAPRRRRAAGGRARRPAAGSPPRARHRGRRSRRAQRHGGRRRARRLRHAAARGCRRPRAARARRLRDRRRRLPQRAPTAARRPPTDRRRRGLAACSSPPPRSSRPTSRSGPARDRPPHLLAAQLARPSRRGAAGSARLRLRRHARRRADRARVPSRRAERHLAAHF